MVLIIKIFSGKMLNKGGKVGELPLLFLYFYTISICKSVQFSPFPNKMQPPILFPLLAALICAKNVLAFSASPLPAMTASRVHKVQALSQLNMRSHADSEPRKLSGRVGKALRIGGKAGLVATSLVLANASPAFAAGKTAGEEYSTCWHGVAWRGVAWHSFVGYASCFSKATFTAHKTSSRQPQCVRKENSVFRGCPGTALR